MKTPGHKCLGVCFVPTSTVWQKKHLFLPFKIDDGPRQYICLNFKNESPANKEWLRKASVTKRIDNFKRLLLFEYTFGFCMMINQVRYSLNQI